MAWIFSLSAECGSDETQAKLFAQYFEGMTWTLSNGCQCQCQTDTFQDIDENWWCRVYPKNLSEIGIESPKSAYLMTESGILFYQHLRSAPAFRYALVGVEVDEFRTYSELLEDSSKLSIPGLVLAAEVGQEIKLSSAYRPFSPGYVWLPYEGEIYNPLMASPSLKSKLNELLLAS
ncbi:MAG: hypothetical protein KME14_01830 [Tildeniella torsiva UHER 1998/13D]|jgi:hypothetical protein|nr:hypothetical protein [Tildeniella torsiva UHER 1998/13D]